jgi:DNA polymerase I-like protein with 3'-5' exonuclease and polymerase domains
MPNRSSESSATPNTCKQQCAAKPVSAWATQLLADLSPTLCASDAAMLKQQLAVLEKAPSGEAPPAKADPIRPTIVRAAKGLDALACKVAAAAEVVINLENSGSSPDSAVIVGVGIALQEMGFYIPLDHRFDHEAHHRRPNQLPLIDVLDALRLHDKPLIAHDAKAILKWVRHHVGIAWAFAWDTMIAARLLRPDLPADDLEKVAIRELGVSSWRLPLAEMQRVQVLPIETVGAMCAKDCSYTRLLYDKQKGAMP